VVAEPPSDWEIPMMYRRGRYDVGLDLDGRVTFWSTEVDLVKVIEAVTEVLVLKEKSPDEFPGNIIIRPSADIGRDSGPEYNGSKCEEDSSDRSSSGDRHLQSVGGGQPGHSDYFLSYPDRPPYHGKTMASRSRNNPAARKHS
jgi:hypothetical protein